MDSPWQGAKRVLVVRLDNMGDVVMLSPALRSLRQALPKADITLMASAAGAQAAPLLPWVDKVIVHRAVWQDASWSLPLDPERETRLIDTLRALRFDVAVIFTSFSQSPYPPAYACYLAGIPVRIGQSSDFGGSVLSHWIDPPPNVAHQVDRNLHLLESTGLPLAGRYLEIHVPEDARESVNLKLARMGIGPDDPFLLVAPGASCPARTYDPARYGGVVTGLSRHLSLPVVLVGDAREASRCEAIQQLAPGTRSLAGQTTVPELAALIRRGTLVIANDSGPMHIADALARPMVILFSGTDLESQWEPRNAPARLLRQPTACAPCYEFHCPFQMECLDVPAHRVVEEALDLLKATEVTSGPLPEPA